MAALPPTLVGKQPAGEGTEVNLERNDLPASEL